MAAPVTESADRLLDTAAVSVRLGVHENTLKRWRRTGTGPRYIRVSRSRVRYRVRDLESWLSANTVIPMR